MTRHIAESVSVQTFRQKLRILKRVISETVNSVEGKVSLRILKRIQGESVSISTAFAWTRTLIRHLGESVSIQSFRIKPRILLRIITETVNVARTRFGVFQESFQQGVFQSGYEVLRIRGIGKLINEFSLYLPGTIIGDPLAILPIVMLLLIAFVGNAWSKELLEKQYE